VLILGGLVFYTDNLNSFIREYFLADYYLLNSFTQTKAENVVTAIYLNYRVYDTLFETLMLLVCVLAIRHFSRRGSDFYG
jgi:multisubunit Na+/H+ antiporter MnhB subunit